MASVDRPEAAPPTDADDALRRAFERAETLRLDRVIPAQRQGEAVAHREVRSIHASVLRDLLLSPGPPSERCVRQLSIVGATIEGPLDLRFAQVECPIRLQDCHFTSTVTLTEASLRSVSLRGCSGTSIEAGHVRVTGDLVLDDLHLTGYLRLDGAHLDDDLHLNGASIYGPRHRHGPEPVGNGAEAALLTLANIDVQGKVEARGLEVRGGVDMDGARIAGTLRLQQSRLGRPPAADTTPDADNIAWYGDGLCVDGEVDATGLVATGQVRLVDARVQSLVLRDARISSPTTALLMDRLDCRGSVYLDEGCDIAGGIHAIGTFVGGSVYVDRAHVRAGEGRPDKAIDLGRSHIVGRLSCAGLESEGAIAISGANIEGSVRMAGALLQRRPGSTRAFVASAAQVGRDLSLADGFRFDGAITLTDTRVGGRVIVDDRSRDRRSGVTRDARMATLQGPSPALDLSGLEVARDLRLRTRGTIDLHGAHIAGEADLDLSRLSSSTDEAAADLTAVRADVLTLRGRPGDGFLDLTRAEVRLLLDDPAEWSRDSLVVLDGLMYADLRDDERDRESVHRRLEWLAAGTRRVRAARGGYDDVGFTPQPYRQLADVYRRTAQDSHARMVLHEMCRRHNSTMNRRRPLLWLWNGLQEIFLGYGYRPLLALAWVVVLAGLTSVWYAYFDFTNTQSGTDVGPVEAVIFSLALVLPGSGYDRIAPSAEPLGTTGLVFAALLVLIGLLLGATVIAALGRALRR